MGYVLIWLDIEISYVIFSFLKETYAGDGMEWARDWMQVRTSLQKFGIAY